MQIRPEVPHEFPAIFALVQRAFATARVSNGQEQHFVDRLRASTGYLPDLALVGEEHGELLGHIMLTRTHVETSAGPHPLLLLGPVAIVPERRGQGLGSQLIRDTLRRAQGQGHTAVILVGDPAFYTRLGFQAAATFGIANTNDIPDQYVLACELAPGALKNAGGGAITFEV
ncbi:GNAT family N-acetyltransferase [Megalodesulfovibrio gigas]|uniref:Putative N-acetyltransferase GCN5 n=1 Tax=Megalodesulfovibrio gigas (strain ATCC 19364 / DSM 1382 / NCIMB 9332 / VKM B-1759) TaxID=1121448 RepID=T2GFK3_MEGG1|nr:N-acetyltransferase [Megalodesulfovibrio gigas]AGW14687.1 putative N-acetyltransferase GCN5 [Megalodesulfovibrio gigas DSM 1382 = ATCC 19364]